MVTAKKRSIHPNETEPDPFKDFFAHMAGKSGQPLCQYAQLAEHQGQCLKLDWRSEQFSSLTSLIRKATGELIDWSQGLPQNPRGMDLHNILVLVSPDCLDSKSEAIIQRMRPVLLKYGLMIGLFHPHSRLYALTSKTQRFPFRTRHSFVSIRFAVYEDAVFLSENELLSKLLETWLDRQKTLPSHQVF